MADPTPEDIIARSIAECAKDLRAFAYRIQALANRCDLITGTPFLSFVGGLRFTAKRLDHEASEVREARTAALREAAQIARNRAQRWAACGDDAMPVKAEAEDIADAIEAMINNPNKDAP